MGEFLPFQLSRMDLCHDDLHLEKSIAHRPSYYLRDNVLITTSGVLSHSALIVAHGNADRILRLNGSAAA
jgi:2,3-dihydroxybenzoate decarboxylase